MPGVQQQAPQGSERSLQPERRRDKATRRYGNHRDTKRLWTACKTRDSGPRCVKQESPGFCPGEVQVTITDVPKKLMPVKTLQTTTPAAPPASAPANYTIDAFAFSTDGTSTPDCTPFEMNTSSTATG